MTTEQQFFITLLRDHLHGRKTVPPKDALNWNALQTLASSHQLSPILFHQCGKWLAGYSPETFQRLLEYHTAHLLLPAAWVYRWGYVIRHKFKHGMNALTEPFGKRKQVETRVKKLNDWGL